MKVTEHIKYSNNKPSFSVEILPPLKGENIQDIFKALEPLMEIKPTFVDVTYHREEYEYKETKEGLWEKRIIRKRPGTVGICAALQNRFGVDAVPHVLCGGFTKEETENLLIDLHFLGIDNIVALRGDAVKSEIYFKPKKQGHRYANELVRQIDNQNQGIYLDNELLNTTKTNFCIGVAGYPEKHIESPNMDADIQFLKQKIDSGASYIITQLFYDNQKFYDFVEKSRAAGITTPIIPGIKPLSTKRQLNLIPYRFNVDIPIDLANDVIKAKTKEDVIEIGIEWMIEQSKDLYSKGFNLIHFYTMGKTDPICRLAKTIL